MKKGGPDVARKDKRRSKIELIFGSAVQVPTTQTLAQNDKPIAEC